MAITLDLKTLNLPAGEHTIQTMAMKNGKAISYLSAGVSYTVTPEPTPSGLNKGDIIKFDAFGDGNLKRFRVLTVNNNIVKLFGLDDFGTSTHKVSDYDSSDLDIRLNNTYYSALAANIKNNIITEDFLRTSWHRTNDQPSKFDVSTTWLYSGDTAHAYYSARSDKDTIIKNKRIHALDFSELIEYFGSTLTWEEVNDFFAETTGAINKTIWLASDGGSLAHVWGGMYGLVYEHGYYTDDTFIVRPVFKIDLTNIPYIKETNNLVEKGDIIKFDAFGNGTQERFRVLKCNGNVAKLFALTNYQRTAFGNTSKIYASSNVDTILNTTYYNNLTNYVKQAIIKTNINQSTYSWTGQSWRDEPLSGADFSIKNTKDVMMCYTKTSFVPIGERYCYALDIDDIIEYFNLNTGNILSSADFLVFYNLGETTNGWVWTRSASASGFNIFTLSSASGVFWEDSYNANVNVRPAFQIDLSKITWTKEG